MNMFNLGYLINFFTSVFMNKFDSSFNMLTSNISAVRVQCVRVSQVLCAFDDHESV